MEIKLKKEDNVKLLYSECPRCHHPFDMKKRKKTEHHAIPIFLKPKTEVTINLCLECHNELNNCYSGREINSQKYRYKSGTFEEFKATYEDLRKDFFDKKLNRGQFGEGLWSNLMTFLEAKENEKK